MSQPDDMTEFNRAFEKEAWAFGLARLKTEGEPIIYDTGAGPPGPPLPRWRRRLNALAERLRYLPARLWWAVFGDEYY